MAMPRYLDEIHGQAGFFDGVPVFENTCIRKPTAVNVPIPGTNYIRTKLIVPSWHAFENEIWIEVQLHRTMRENMGDTLEWLYGPGARKTWISPSSRYSQLMVTLTLKRSLANLHNTLADAARAASHFARTMGAAFGTAGGHSYPLQDFGSTLIPNALSRAIQIVNLATVE
jgi:hypothetical protein